MDNILIKQPAGIGDIFFTQKIAHTLAERYNCRIIWPVLDDFIWVKDYLVAPNVDFIPLSSNFKYKEVYEQPIGDILEIEGNCVYLPLQHADWSIPGSVMDAKYKFVDLKQEDWLDYFNFERNIEKENKLYYDVLGLKDGEQYSLVNRQFASPPYTQICKHIKVETLGKYVEMSYLPEYTLFDWCKVIENAQAIHTVETSLNYILEKLNPKCQLEMYSKYDPPSYGQVQHLFKINWNYNY
jgi:hypothetical protein